MTKWLIKKKMKLNGRWVDVEVPNPKIPREVAYKRLQELLRELVKKKSASVPRKL